MLKFTRPLSNSYGEMYSTKYLYLKKKKTQINDLSFQLKKVKKEEQIKPKFSRIKNIIIIIKSRRQ